MTLVLYPPAPEEVSLSGSYHIIIKHLPLVEGGREACGGVMLLRDPGHWATLKWKEGDGEKEKADRHSTSIQSPWPYLTTVPVSPGLSPAVPHSHMCAFEHQQKEQNPATARSEPLHLDKCCALPARKSRPAALETSRFTWDDDTVM